MENYHKPVSRQIMLFKRNISIAIRNIFTISRNHLTTIYEVQFTTCLMLYVKKLFENLTFEIF